MNKKLGMLYSCNRDGVNAEPIEYGLADAMTRDEVLQVELGDDEYHLRPTNGDDDCDASVDYVAVNADGKIGGYYQFREGWVVISVSNPGNHLTNPLLKLSGRSYRNRDEACEAIYGAMYDYIDSELGCEFVDREQWVKADMDDDAALCAIDDYIAACRDYIFREGWATHDGVTAHVETTRDEQGQ